ncbi:MAG: hypothetical protein ABIG68_05905, partial [Acidobacteriota bacterium]
VMTETTKNADALRTQLLTIAKSAHKFVKQASALVQSQCGDPVKAAADKTAQDMVERGAVAAKDRNLIALQLRFNKRATFDGLVKLATQVRQYRQLVEAGQVQLGTSVGKLAADGERESERIWHDGMSSLGGG